MKRVLIVDDALELGRLLQTVFLTLDATLSIQVVPSAEEALLESSRKPLDLLVSDIRLPGMSGFDLVKKIRGRHASLKVMVITGMTDPSLADRARELKVDGFFRKPLDMSAFIETAARCLDMQRPEGSTLAAEPVSRQFVTPGSDNPVGLSALVAGLRQRLGAMAVFLINEQGRILVNAGEAPSLPLESQWAGPVMTVLKAGQTVAQLVGGGPLKQVMAFPGSQMQVVLAPAGDFALLVFFQPGPSCLRLALAVEEALAAQEAMAGALAELGVKKAVPVPEPAEAPASPAIEKQVELPPTAPLEIPPSKQPEPQPEGSLVEFENLLKQSESEIKNQDIDQFWDALTAAGTAGTPTNSDAITYEQAQKLGLAPKDE
jgi:CheY-like chemotaxis protein